MFWDVGQVHDRVVEQGTRARALPQTAWALIGRTAAEVAAKMEALDARRCVFHGLAAADAQCCIAQMDGENDPDA